MGPVHTNETDEPYPEIINHRQWDERAYTELAIDDHIDSKFVEKWSKSSNYLNNSGHHYYRRL